jgi:hypothetical protein
MNHLAIPTHQHIIGSSTPYRGVIHKTIIILPHLFHSLQLSQLLDGGILLLRLMRFLSTVKNAFIDVVVVVHESFDLFFDLGLYVGHFDDRVV